MTQCSTKPSLIRMNKSAFSLVELMMAVSFSVLLMTGVYGFYNTSRQSFNSGISGQILQDGANIILNKIIEGATETGGLVYRLSSSASYSIPNGTTGLTTSYLYTCGNSSHTTTPCNTTQPSSEIYFCQDTPIATNCNYNDATARWYYLNSSATAIIYHHTSTSGATVEDTVYTAPKGSTMTLRFAPAAVNTPLTVVEVDVALTQTLSAQITNARMATSGAASTFILLRNHV